MSFFVVYDEERSYFDNETKENVMKEFDVFGWDYSTEMMSRFVAHCATLRDSRNELLGERSAQMFVQHGGKAFGLTLCEALQSSRWLTVPAWKPGLWTEDGTSMTDVIVRSSASDEDWLNPKAGEHESIVLTGSKSSAAAAAALGPSVISQLNVPGIGYVVDVAHSPLLGRAVVRIARGNRGAGVHTYTSPTWDLESTIGVYELDGTPIAPLLDRFGKDRTEDEGLSSFVSQLVRRLRTCGITFGVQLEIIGLNHLVQIRPSPASVRHAFTRPSIDGVLVATTGAVMRAGDVMAEFANSVGKIGFADSGTMLNIDEAEYAGLLTDRPIMINSSHGCYWRNPPNVLTYLALQHERILTFRLPRPALSDLRRRLHRNELELRLVSDGIVGQVYLLRETPRPVVVAPPAPIASHQVTLAVEEHVIGHVPDDVDEGEDLFHVTFEGGVPFYLTTPRHSGTSGLSVVGYGDEVYGRFVDASRDSTLHGRRIYFVRDEKKYTAYEAGTELFVSDGDYYPDVYVAADVINAVISQRGHRHLWRAGELGPAYNGIEVVADRYSSSDSYVLYRAWNEQEGKPRQTYVVLGPDIHGPFVQVTDLQLVDGKPLFATEELDPASFSYKRQYFVQWGERRYGPFPNKIKDLAFENGVPVFTVKATTFPDETYALYYGDVHEGTYHALKFTHAEDGKLVIRMRDYSSNPRSLGTDVVRYNGQTYGPYGKIGDFRVVDGHALFAAWQNGRFFVVMDGVEGRSYSFPGGPSLPSVYLSEGKPLYDVNGCVVHGDQESPGYRSVIGTGSHGRGGHALPYFLVQLTEKEFAVLARGVEGRSYDRIGLLDDANGKPLYCAEHDGRRYVVLGDTEYAQVNKVDPIWLQGFHDKPLYVSQDGAGGFLITHGEAKSPSYDQVYDLVVIAGVVHANVRRGLTFLHVTIA